MDRLSAWPAIRLRHFKRFFILQEIRDSASPKRMGRECIRQPGVFESAFEHSGCINSGRPAVPEFSRLTYRNRKEGVAAGRFVRPDMSKYRSRSSSSLWCIGISVSLPLSR